MKCFCLFWRCWCSLGISIQPLSFPSTAVPMVIIQGLPLLPWVRTPLPPLLPPPLLALFQWQFCRWWEQIPVVTVAPELRSEVANLQVKCYFFLAAEVKGSNLSLMKTPDPGLLGLGGKSGSSAECFGSQFLWEGLSDWWLRLKDKQSLEEVIRVILSRSPQLWQGVTSPSPAATPSPFCVN